MWRISLQYHEIKSAKTDLKVQTHTSAEWGKFILWLGGIEWGATGTGVFENIQFETSSLYAGGMLQEMESVDELCMSQSY